MSFVKYIAKLFCYFRKKNAWWQISLFLYSYKYFFHNHFYVTLMITLSRECLNASKHSLKLQPVVNLNWENYLHVTLVLVWSYKELLKYQKIIFSYIDLIFPIFLWGGKFMNLSSEFWHGICRNGVKNRWSFLSSMDHGEKPKLWKQVLHAMQCLKRR